MGVYKVLTVGVMIDVDYSDPIDSIVRTAGVLEDKHASKPLHTTRKSTVRRSFCIYQNIPWPITIDLRTEFCNV